MSARVPEKPSLDGIEPRWSEQWESSGIYRFDRNIPKSRDEVYSIDTPPPTVSGSLHIGHVFSYTHTDAIARYKRMRGYEVFYPMGWDDNGVPTERRVQNYFGVACDPSLHYDESFQAPAKPGDSYVHTSRRNFVELCERLTEEDEKIFENLWRFLGLSVDWSTTYATIDDRAQKASQRSFLRLLSNGRAYQSEAPTLWDVDFKTAVSQAELEDRERPGAYHRIRFELDEGTDWIGAEGHEPGGVEIETTRPELLAACVALVAHPDDSRYQPLFGKTVVTPLFKAQVSVLAHPLADPEKGSGIAMICTFGDVTDVLWWRELGLPTRTIISRDGRLLPIEWGTDGWESLEPEAASESYSKVAGRNVKQAQQAIVEMLKSTGDLKGEPKPITHPVKFYEKGERPLEIVSSRQWFIRTMDLVGDLKKRGEELKWFPGYMKVRFQTWVEGLNTDWNVSRQRYFGVPIPVWYRLDQNGEVDFSVPLVPGEDRLPVDPTTDVPEGYSEADRGKPGGFVGDPDVLDTWATSSLTPQIAGGWEEDPELFSLVFPMDLRPQAHDIIRTWLFTTVVRSHLEHDCLPFYNAAISGFVLDPDRKKMSKSKGNVVTPMPLLESHGADAVRYWAASAHLGVDTSVDEGQMKVGRRLATKILNASRFTLSNLDSELIGMVSADWESLAKLVTEPIDKAMLTQLAKLVDSVTAAFEDLDTGRVIERSESFFWHFCDDYLELVKNRSYGAAGEAGQRSAQAALAMAISTLTRIFAPVLPFVTEEVWSWFNEGSVHRSPWPNAGQLTAAAGTGPQGAEVSEGDVDVFEACSEALAFVRRSKTQAKRSMRTPVATMRVEGPRAVLEALKAGSTDLVHAGVLSSPPELVETETIAAGSSSFGISVEVELEAAD